MKSIKYTSVKIISRSTVSSNVLYRGCRGYCNANENIYICIYTNLNKKHKQKNFHYFIHTTFQKLLSSDCWKRIFNREWLSASHNCFHSNGGFWAKSMRNTGQGARLETICPEIFFDILTGGCIFNP